MKKRMFITTIVMMLVLAVALTTSSLAWFSSANTSVTADAATFKAAAASSANVNLKISDTMGGWGDSIKLTDGDGRTMAGLVPVAPLVSAEVVGSDITTTGVEKNGEAVSVIHKGYVWPGKMVFNSAKIGSESNFVIDADANSVDTYGDKTTNTTAQNSAAHYYYDYFYIQNADSQNTIGSLTFKLDSTISTIANGTTGYEAGDYTARGYAAFILFDQVKYSVGATVPTNAFENGGKTVVAYATADITTAQVREDSADSGYIAWIPFCAFTIATKKGNSDTFKETAWQFADLDAKNGNGAFVYNGTSINDLKTQNYDAVSGIGNNDGFTLNSASLQALNNKIVNATTGNVDNSGEGYVRTSSTDSGESGSTFIMQPHETFLISMYYWLDGISLTEYTDTTVSQIGVQIVAAK